MAKAGIFLLFALVATVSFAEITALASPPHADQVRAPITSPNVIQDQQANRGHAIPAGNTGATSTSPLYVEATCKHGCGYTEDSKGWWQKLWTDPVATFTAFLAVFTVVLAGTSVWQGWLTKQSINLARSEVELARSEFVSTHRPRIILREAIIGNVKEGKKIDVYFTLANVGETWGKIVKSVVDVEVVYRAATRRLKVTSLEIFNDIGELKLVPGQAHMLEFDKLKRRANSPEAPVWVATNFSVKTDYKRNDFGKSTEYQYHDPSIHIVGQFLYEDSDGLLRRTAFRRKLDPERERFYRLDGEPDLDYAD